MNQKLSTHPMTQNEIKATLKKEMKIQKHTQQSLSDATGVERSQVGRFFINNHVMIDRLVILAEELGLEVVVRKKE